MFLGVGGLAGPTCTRLKTPRGGCDGAGGVAAACVDWSSPGDLHGGVAEELPLFA